MESLLPPISDQHPCGEDPRYLETFSELKSEIEKKSDVDYERIERLAENILQDHAKDFRVASYWALARTKLFGISGLFEGLALIVALSDRFGQQVHPAKIKAKVGALQWLQQPKVLTFALAKPGPFKPEKLEQFTELLGSYNKLIADVTGEHAAWPELAKFLKAELDQFKKVVDKPQSDAQVVPDRPVSSATVTAAPTAVTTQGMPSSSGQFQQQARLLIRYCKEQKLYGQMVGLARGLLWGGLSMPSHDNKQTKVPAIAVNTLSRVRTLLEQEQYIDAFLAAEEGFLAPGGLFCMDMQYLSISAARKAGLDKEASLIEAELVGLYKRIPKLFQLTYDNGDAFASATVMSWLEQATEHTSTTSDAQSAYATWYSECSTIFSESGLEQALEYLSQCPASNEFDRLQLNALQAKLLVEGGYEAIALPIYLKLNKEIERLSLMASQPEFCLNVWRVLHRLLSTATAAEPSLQERNQRLMDELFDRVCLVDARKAVQWFS